MHSKFVIIFSYVFRINSELIINLTFLFREDSSWTIGLNPIFSKKSLKIRTTCQKIYKFTFCCCLND